VKRIKKPRKSPEQKAYEKMVKNKDMEGLYNAARVSLIKKCYCHECFSCYCRVAYYHLRKKYNLYHLKEV